MTKVSQAGQEMLKHIAAGVNTPEGLDKVMRRDPEATSRTIASLMNRGLLVRQFRDGQMRYFIKAE